jgi:phage tail protein X
MIYVTREGEVLDLICHQIFGKTDGVVEEVLELNPHLAELPAVLPEGIEIVLPSPPRSARPERREISLWD